MAIIFGPSPIALKVGVTTSAGIQFADNVTTVRATLTHWNGQSTTSCFIEFSFDGGVTWKSYGGVGPSSSPSGTFKNRSDLWVQIDGVWKVCGFVFPAGSRYRPGQTCGEVYVPGAGANAQLLVHSDYAFQDITPLRDLSPITFHNPDLTPAAGPLRQVRVVCEASGNINSQLVVDAS